MSDLDLEQYRRRAEEFVGALDLEYYEHFSGRKPRCDTAAVYDRYPELFTREAIDGLEELYAVAVDDEKLRLAYLLAFTVDGFMGEQTKHLGDEIANTEGETTITVDGETIGLRQASVAQGNEPDRARRARIQEARLAATAERLNPLLDTLWRRCHDLALELGYPDYKELYGTVRGLDYDHLRAELEGFLADTEGLYERVMDRLVRERLGVTLAELAFADLPYLWRAEGFDPRLQGRRPRALAARARSPGWASTSTPSPTCTSTPRSASSSRRAPSARPCAYRTRSTSSCCRTAVRTTTACCCTRPGTPSTSRTCAPTSPSSTGTSATTPSPRDSRSRSTT